LPPYAAVGIDQKDPRAAEFMQKFPGSYGYEVESLAPVDLQQKIIRAIRPHINQQQFDLALKIEDHANAELKRLLPGALQNVLGQLQMLPEFTLESQRKVLGMPESANGNTSNYTRINEPENQ
jgi:hypothetical protein